MKRMFGVAALALFVLAGQSGIAGQLLSYREAPVRISHYHLNVTSIAAQKKFWVDTLGGTAMQFGRDEVDVIKLPDVFIFLHVQKPTGPNRGTAFDHIGLASSNVPAIVEKLKANGLYRPTVGRDCYRLSTTSQYLLGGNCFGAGQLSVYPDDLFDAADNNSELVKPG